MAATLLLQASRQLAAASCFVSYSATTSNFNAHSAGEAEPTGRLAKASAIAIYRRSVSLSLSLNATSPFLSLFLIPFPAAIDGRAAAVRDVHSS